jgi:hypothetical protein
MAYGLARLASRSSDLQRTIDSMHHDLALTADPSSTNASTGKGSPLFRILSKSGEDYAMEAVRGRDY